MSVVVVAARRRKPRVSGDSEEFSEDSYDDNEPNKGSEGDTDFNASSEGLRESEYETLDEAGESESDGTTAIDDERELSDSVIIEYEREEGDGQESAPPKEKKLDDDEDRRNPQYIPKRGTFYEHDDRTAVEDVVEETVEKESERSKETEKKKVWKEQENKWSHDRYNEDDQAPKSRDELIAIYGYDIRNEDAPPRARRRRKYGRGPNKYTRNWEDEDAYGKTGGIILRGGGAGRRGGRGGPRKPFIGQPGDSEEEFPPLNNTGVTNRGYNTEGHSKPEPPHNSQIRGSNRGSYRGRHSGTYQHTSRDVGLNPDIGEDVPNEETTISSDTNNGSKVPNAWKINSNQNKKEIPRVRDDKKPIKELNKSVPSNTNVISNAFSKNRPMADDTKDKVEENGWKNRRDRSKPRVPYDDPNVVSPSGNSGWRGKNKGERRVVQSIPVESQTFTPSAPRGRGRGQRGGGPSRQTLQFKPSLSAEKNENSRRSLSETRMTTHDNANNAEGSYIKSQVVNRTTDDMVKELSRVSISEHQAQVSNRDYTRKPTKNPPNYHQVPPRMQENAANKPKRYSSQRQRSLPETGVSAAAAVAAAAAAYAPPHGFYPPTGYAQPPEELEGMGVVSPGYVQPPPVYGEAPQPQPPPPPVVAQPPASTPPMALLPPPHPQAPAYATPPFSSPPTFIPPPVAGPPPRILPPGPATYMTAAPTGAPIINYVATPPQNQFAPQAFAPFQGYTAVPAAQPPPELYQPQGITYYSPEEQVMSRTITQKRQSTAIPIVPPPEKGPRGRGQLREENSIGHVSPGVIDHGAGGDATSASMKVAQLEDASDSKKVELVPQEIGNMQHTPIECISENSQDTESMEVSKKTTVSPNIINEINITEIPDSAESVAAAKTIQAAAIPNTENSLSDYTTEVEEVGNVPDVLLPDTTTSENLDGSSSAADVSDEMGESNLAVLNVSSSEQEIQA